MAIKNFLLRQREYLPLWVSLLIVLLVSYYTLHPDFVVITNIAEKIASGNLHIYEDLYIGGANYHIPAMPPLICLIDGLNYFFFKELGVLNFSFDLIRPTPPFHVLLLKSRYILIFILSYFLIFKTALLYTKQDKKLSRRIANLWIASPLFIYLPFAQGNNDIYPAFFSLIFLFFAFRKNFILAMIFLGLTAAMKSYALFLIIPVALILAQKDVKKTILYSFTSGLVYFLPKLFYLKESASYTANISESFNMLNTIIPSHAGPYSLFAVGYFLILLFLYYGDNLKKIIEDTNRTLVIYCFLVLSLFYMTWYYPQWFLWILPFFIFLIYKNKKLYSIYLLISLAYFICTYVQYPGNLDIYLFHYYLPILAGKNIFFLGTMYTNKPLLAFITGFFLSLFIAFIYFLLQDKRKEEDDKVSIYLSYLPTIVLLLAIVIFSFLSK